MNPFNFEPLKDLDLAPLGPMLVVALTGVFALLVHLFRQKDNRLTVAVSLLGLVAAASSAVFQMSEASYQTAGGMIQMDALTLSMQLLLIAAAAVAILFSEGYLQEKRIAFGEFYPLVLWSTFGGMVMVSTQNLLMLFLGLEVLSISLYVLAGMSRSEEKSEESAIKYFLLGAFSSGFLLYGIAMTYGATGGLDLSQIGYHYAHGDSTTQALLVFSLGLMLIGLCFKAALVPFHQWTPDVYQGAPTNVSTFMATGSKIAAFGAMWRVLDGAFIMRDIWIPALAVIAALTMTVGNLIALTQKDVKRVLGYSSIAHAGYILVAVLAHFKEPNRVGASTTVFYLLSYLLMTAGAFAIVSLSAKDGREGTTFKDLNGLYRRAPLAAVALVVCVVSLIGIPPASGFFGKFLIFSDAVTAHMLWLAILLAVNSAISLYYYLGMAWSAFVSEEDSPEIVSAKPSVGLTAVALICSVGVFAVAIFFQPITSFLAK